jgi:predicted membrane metal-binding protein
LNSKQLFKKAPLAPFALLFSAGIFFEKVIHLPLWMAIAFTFIIIFLSFLPKIRTTEAVIFLLVLSGGILRMGSSQWHVAKIENNLAQLNGETVRISGEITDIRETNKGFRYTVSIDSIMTNIVIIRENVKVNLYTENDFIASMGNKIDVAAVWREILSPRNPGEFDFQKYYKQQNIWAKAFMEEEKPSSITVQDGFSFSTTIYDLRMSIRDLFNEKVGGDAGKLMSALILGLREEVPGEIKAGFCRYRCNSRFGCIRASRWICSCNRHGTGEAAASVVEVGEDSDHPSADLLCYSIRRKGERMESDYNGRYVRGSTTCLP